MSRVRTIVLTALATISILGIVAIGFVFSGIYNIGADAHHTKPALAMIDASVRSQCMMRFSSGIFP